MKMKGAYLFWLVILVFILYLIFEYFGINFLYLIGKIVGVLFLLYVGCHLFLFAVLVPIMYSIDYFNEGGWNDTFQNYYKNYNCQCYMKDFIIFHPVYWLIVIIIEINKFCNKYFTFKL